MTIFMHELLALVGHPGLQMFAIVIGLCIGGVYWVSGKF